MRKSLLPTSLILLLSAAPSLAAATPQSLLRSAAATAIQTIPTTQPAPDFTARGCEGIFFTGPLYHNKPTRVFAWIGFPPNLKPGDKAPAVVLVHGGGGTAFANWISIWTKLGYIAIAPDTAGQLPIHDPPGAKTWKRNPDGGPPGWGGFDQIDEAPTDQWPYQSTLDVILANSLLRSYPQVDTTKVGLVGISWGGYLTDVCVGLDNRYAFAVPVYGCGFLGEDSAWVPDMQKIGPEKTAAWLQAFDPSQYLPAANLPMLWVDGTNDVNYPLDVLQKSYLLPKGPITLATRVRMKHSHAAGMAPQEIYAFANSICKGSDPLPTVTAQGQDATTAWATCDSQTPLTKAELNYTTDTGLWKLRKWQTAVATIGPNNKISAPIPPGTTAYYFNITDNRNLIVSTQHRDLEPAPTTQPQ